MSFPFNKQLWEFGRKVEDMALPIINRLYECDFKRNDNDIYDILDFRDEEQKKIVEVKGRRILSTKFTDTIFFLATLFFVWCLIDSTILGSHHILYVYILPKR